MIGNMYREYSKRKEVNSKKKTEVKAGARKLYKKVFGKKLK